MKDFFIPTDSVQSEIDLTPLFIELENCIKTPIPSTLVDFFTFIETHETKEFFIYFKTNDHVWHRFYPSFFLKLAKILHSYKNGYVPKNLIPIATDIGGDYLFMSIPHESSWLKPFQIYFVNHEDEHMTTNFVAPSLNAVFKIGKLEDEKYPLELMDTINRCVDTYDSEALAKLIDEGKWRVNEFYKYGSTIADFLLSLKDRKYYGMVKMLIEKGAVVPRFGDYAGNWLSEDEIVYYLKHEALPLEENHHNVS